MLDKRNFYINGKEDGTLGLEEYLEVKTTWIKLD